MKTPRVTDWVCGETVRTVDWVMNVTKNGAIPPGVVGRLGSLQRVDPGGVECWLIWLGDGTSWGVSQFDVEPCYGPIQKIPFLTLVNIFYNYQNEKPNQSR